MALVIARLRAVVPAWPVLAVAMLLIWQPGDDGVTICPFARITGTACPGCGLTRALAWMVRGDLDRTFFYHPLAPIVLVEVAVGWGLWMAKRRGIITWVNQRWMDLALAATAVALVAVWLLRWAGGSLPPVWDDPRTSPGISRAEPGDYRFGPWHHRCGRLPDPRAFCLVDGSEGARGDR